MKKCVKLVISKNFSVLDFYSFVSKKSLKMAPWCRNMLEINSCLCVLLSAFVGCCISHKNKHGISNTILAKHFREFVGRRIHLGQDS